MPEAKETVPSAFMNGANSYFKAAENVMTGESVGSADPAYMLMFHAAELALTSALRAKGVSTAKLKAQRHNLVELLKQVEKLGFSPDTKTLDSIRKVVTLLYSGNKQEAFRYWSAEATTIPEADWARTVVASLLNEVGKFLEPPPLPEGRKYILVPAAVRVSMIQGPT